MTKKIIGTEFVGKHNKISATGILKELGIKEVYSAKDIDLHGIVDYLLRTKPEQLTDHAYKFGKYMVKFYKPESFGFLGYCQQLGLPVENPLAMGINKRNEGDIVIVDTIEGKDYQDIVLGEKKNLLGRIGIPKKEMNALGNTFYLFCSKGIVVGDSKLQNYMYNGSQAVRIDLIFNFSSLHILDWNEINQDLELAKEKSEELWKLVDEGECIFRDIAATLTHRPQSTRRFCNNLEAFLQGYVNDSLSKNLAYVFQKIANGLIPYIQKAEKESKPFEGVYWSDKFTKMQKSTGKVTIRWFDH